MVSVPALGVEATVGAGQSMLEALEEAGVDVMSDCRKGECDLCQVKVLGLQGRVDHRDVFFSDEQKTDTGKMCVCVSRAVPATATSSGTVTDAHASALAHPTGERARVTLDVPVRDAHLSATTTSSRSTASSTPQRAVTTLRCPWSSR
ncbi:2Fe-2S iron-sulfur cluster-binding protein [Streptomyces sp. NPDC058231]|uniref:2Fe-2S iron-sulfur cluster-binding protein n=1 Tax=Streptomyces sp. NPDC058231 TaxID=3346392 RepID=UPI0036EF8CC5